MKQEIRIAKALIKLAKTLIAEQDTPVFDTTKNYDWEEYKSVGDIRHLYPIENGMEDKYANDKFFKNACEKGYLIFDDNGKLIQIHSKETIGRGEPQTCGSEDYALIIGAGGDDCYPIPKKVFEEKYIHKDGSEYYKIAGQVVQAIVNPQNKQIIIKHRTGDLYCKPDDYIIKRGDNYAVVDKDIFEKTYVKAD